MAGQPKKQAMIRELERLTAEEFEGEAATALDYVELVVASGTTITALAEQISAATGRDIKREALSKYVNGLEREATEGTLARARVRAGSAFAEEALETSRTATKDNAQAVALEVKTLQWMAEKADPSGFGQRNGPNVSISVGVLHLGSLRQHQLGEAGAIDSAIAGECELVSSEIIES